MDFKEFLGLNEEVTRGVVVNTNFRDVSSSLIQALDNKQQAALIKALKILANKTHGKPQSNLINLIAEFEDEDLKYSDVLGIEMYSPSTVKFSIGSANGRLRIRGTERERENLLSTTDLDSTIRDLIDSIPTAKAI